MITKAEDLYKKISLVSSEVRKTLRKKGLVIPVKNKNGSISIGQFTIVKDLDGYVILDFDDEVLIQRINLPQTAIVVANKLALGHYRDAKLLALDQQYGYCDFQEELYKKSMPRTDFERYGIYMTKYELVKHKKQQFKQEIAHSFEKLIKLV
jgi:hypothetical protein